MQLQLPKLVMNIHSLKEQIHKDETNCQNNFQANLIKLLLEEQ